MCSGRLCMSGSVVYWSRTKPWNALPPRRSRRKPSIPLRSSTVSRAEPERRNSSRAVATLGAAGSERHAATDDRLVGNRRGADLRAFHVRVGLQKPAGEKPAVRFQVVAREVQRLALDEILHRIGGDQARIVAGFVSGPECVPVDQQGHVGAKDRQRAGWRAPVAIQAVGDDVRLAVVVPFLTAGKVTHAEFPRVGSGRFGRSG